MRLKSLPFALVLPAFFAVMTLIPVFAVAQTTPSTGFACQKDSQCVKIENSCGGAVVNKQSFDDFAPLAENMHCEPPTPSWPQDVAKCYQGTCIITRLSEADFRREWYKCDDDDTCVVAYDGCQDYAVNAKYINDVKEQIKRSHQICKTTSAPHNSQLIGQCVNNMCSLAIRNPKQ